MSSKNHARVNLITRFKCAKCGTQLSLSYDDPKKFADYTTDGITGANKLESNIFIEPCSVCVDEPTRQLETLKKILKG